MPDKLSKSLSITTTNKILLKGVEPEEVGKEIAEFLYAGITLEDFENTMIAVANRLKTSKIWGDKVPKLFEELEKEIIALREDNEDVFE